MSLLGWFSCGWHDLGPSARPATSSLYVPAIFAALCNLCAPEVWVETVIWLLTTSKAFLPSHLTYCCFKSLKKCSVKPGIILEIVDLVNFSVILCNPHIPVDLHFFSMGQNTNRYSERNSPALLDSFDRYFVPFFLFCLAYA